ncbi:hypothetical protein [Halobacteriovorax sp.]|uniref:hypothetical protein n=1 Tax=Halobacteriovorax sp. TaxID=2020862 RepID=UPI003AF2FACE
MKLSAFSRNILKLALVTYAGLTFATDANIKDDISSISVRLKSKQIFTMKNHGNGEFKELAFTRIERPSLEVEIKDKKKQVESVEVAVDESIFTTKTSLINLDISKEKIVKINSNKATTMAKLSHGGLTLESKQAAKVLKNDITSNLNRLMSRIGFKDQTTVKYEIKKLKFECPKLSGRITNCRASYEVVATLNNTQKKDKGLVSIFKEAKNKILGLGEEIQINTYIGELKAINKQLEGLAKSNTDKKKLQNIYVLKKDVQSEILDSYQYTAISNTSAVAFVDKLDKKVIRK